MRYYVSWKDGKPVLRQGEHGRDTPEEAILQHVRACQAKRNKAAARLDQADADLYAIEALAAEHGVAYP